MHFAMQKKPKPLQLLIITDVIGIIGFGGCLIVGSYESMFYVIFLGFGLLLVQTPIVLMGIVELARVGRYMFVMLFTAHWLLLVAFLFIYEDSSSGLRQWLFGLQRP